MKQNTNTTAVPVVTKPKTRGKKPVINFAGIRWDRMTDTEIAEKLWNDETNKGKIKAATLKNFRVTVFLKRKALAKTGRNVAFAGRTVNGEKKTKWVHAKKSAAPVPTATAVS